MDEYVKKKIALIVVELETEETDGTVEECVLDREALSLTDEDILYLVEHTPATATLTAREKEVLAATLKGRRRADTAEELFLSESTVKKHLRSIYAKLGVKNKYELLSLLYRQPN